MKQQWTFIFALVFALLIAVFSVVNVASVPVNYVLGVAQFPLIMIILGSALIGGLIAGLLTTMPMLKQYRTIRSLKRELAAAQDAKMQAEQQGQTPKADAPNAAVNSTAPAASKEPTQTNATAEAEKE